jgi:hypothetical protein
VIQNQSAQATARRGTRRRAEASASDNSTAVIPMIALRTALVPLSYTPAVAPMKRGSTCRVSSQPGVLYCGSCGALNPRSNHFCSACGHQLVDAFHASEGLRVYVTADPGAALVEIVNAGTPLVVLPTEEDLPADFAKVSLEDGRVGYVRLREVEGATDIVKFATPRTPVGCISSTALIAILALLILIGTLVLVMAFRSPDPNADFIAVLACITVVPFLVFVVGFYLYVRKREEEIQALTDESTQQAGTDEIVE